jgi:SARP family transcriptional regulator, regulator of embCAB operon
MDCHYRPRAPVHRPPAWATAALAATGDGVEGIMVGVLGPVQAWRAGRLLPAGPAQRQLVLAMLALRAGTAVPRGELVDALWEQAPASAVNTVHKHICVLRAVLEPARPRRDGQLLATVAGGYELRLAPGSVDALAFSRDTARGRRAAAAGDLPTAAAALSAALGLWRGSALAGLDGPRVPPITQALHEARLAATEDHARVLLALGRPGQAAAALAGPSAGHQLRESLCQLLMLARYQAGDLPGALDAYHGTRQARATELGTDPGPALSGLLRQILRRDPGLHPPATTAAGPCQGMAGRRSRR